MSIKIRHVPCITILCDDCGDDCWEEGTPHWDSFDEARRWIAQHADGWVFSDTEQVCEHCATERLCKASGHAWGEWTPHYSDAMLSIRFCERPSCCHMDYAPRVTP